MRHGFTLVELLVVVSSIAILLAMLAPALDRAVYQAELAQCAGKQKATGSAVVSAAFNYRRLYPDRTRALQPNMVKGYPVGNDHRKVLRSYVGPLNQMLEDPFCKPIDIEGSGAQSNTYSSYVLWFGWKFNGSDGGPGMRRLGDRWTWRDRGYNVLLQDRDVVNAPDREDAGHPDHDGVLARVALQDEFEVEFWTTSKWAGSALQRGLIDINVAYENLSVLRFDRVGRYDSRIGAPDERLTLVPDIRDGDPTTGDPANIVPRD